MEQPTDTRANSTGDLYRRYPRICVHLLRSDRQHPSDHHDFVREKAPIEYHQYFHCFGKVVLLLSLNERTFMDSRVSKDEEMTRHPSYQQRKKMTEIIFSPTVHSHASSQMRKTTDNLSN